MKTKSNHNNVKLPTVSELRAAGVKVSVRHLRRYIPVIKEIVKNIPKVKEPSKQVTRARFIEKADYRLAARGGRTEVRINPH